MAIKLFKTYTEFVYVYCQGAWESNAVREKTIIMMKQTGKQVQFNVVCPWTHALNRKHDKKPKMHCKNNVTT